MMTDSAFAIKNELQHLIGAQIDLLGKESQLSASELDQYHSRAQEIAVLYGELDDMSRRRFYETRSKAS